MAAQEIETREEVPGQMTLPFGDEDEEDEEFEEFEEDEDYDEEEDSEEY